MDVVVVVVGGPQMSELHCNEGNVHFAHQHPICLTPVRFRPSGANAAEQTTGKYRTVLAISMCDAIIS